LLQLYIEVATPLRLLTTVIKLAVAVKCNGVAREMNGIGNKFDKLPTTKFKAC